MPGFESSFVLSVLGVALMALFMVPFALSVRRQERETEQAEIIARDQGLHEPVTLHPVVDVERCVGIGNCVQACPEGVLGLRSGQAVTVSPAKCVGHGLCEQACPMDAIQLVFGTASRGVDIPRLRGNLETNVAGIYVVGELGGMGLIRNAFEQARQCVDGIRSERTPSHQDRLDAVVVGCGPAGLAASLHLQHAGLRCLTIEREDVGGTVRHYPRKKIVMAGPVKLPGFGRIGEREITKEALIETWERIVRKTGFPLNTNETVLEIERLGDRRFIVVTDRGRYHTSRVILAVGRRGVPRKLGVPGEDGSNVSYALQEPEAYMNDRVVVVGGGDSAVEAAIALAEQPGTTVQLSYRRDRFHRIKPANRERLDEFTAAGRVTVWWSSEVMAIAPNVVHIASAHGTREVPNDQVFVFVGGELPAAFLQACGVEIDTKFGER